MRTRGRGRTLPGEMDGPEATPVRHPLTRQQWAIMLTVFGVGLIAVVAAQFTHWSPTARFVPCRPSDPADALPRMFGAAAVAWGATLAVGLWLGCRRSVLAFMLYMLASALIAELLAMAHASGATVCG